MSRPPHIAVLSQRVPFPPNKGDKLRTYHQIRWLRKQGFDISVCTPARGDDERRHLDTLRTDLGVHPVSADPGPGWFRKARGLVEGKPISVSFFHSGRLQRAFDALLDARRVDGVMCTSSSMAEYVFRANALDGSPDAPPFLLMDFMDMDSEKWRQYARRAVGPKAWVFRREARLLGAYERRAYRTFDASLFVAERETELFRAGTGDGGDKLHTIGNGVELGPRPAPAARPPGRANLLFTGVMDYFPNEDAMLWFHEAMWPRIRSRWPNATLTIAGMHPTRKLRQLGQRDGVEVTGYVHDIAPYYAAADVFVAPFRIARGIQNKILQAFATGVPVVTTREGAEGIACEDTVEVAIADDPERFADAVDLLLSDAARHERQRDRARRLVESRYSWDARNATLTELLSAGIAGRAARPAERF